MKPVIKGALISGGTNLFGDGINAFMTWKGMKMQQRENRRAEKLNLKLRGQDIMREERWRVEDRRERDRDREDRLKAEKYQKSVSLLNQFTAIMNRQPQLYQNLIAMNRGRT